MMLIRCGLLIDPATGVEAEHDILISDGKILEIGKSGSIPRAKARVIIDAAGKWVVPGLIDLHVHLREPGQEWKETIKSGCEAAVLGGFTTILSMPNTKPTNDNEEVTRYILEKAKLAGLARVLPIGAVSKGLEGKEMAPYSELRKAGCVAFSDDGEPIYNAGMMRRALEWCRMLGVPIACHEEDKNLSCGGCMNESSLAHRLGLKGMHRVAEDVMVARDIELSRAFKARVHICHVSTARSVELIRRAKNDGILITAEATPHHLVLTEDSLTTYDTNYKMSPPLRAEEDRLALIAGLKDGTIDAVASDHAPHDHDNKVTEFGRAAFGILGLQTSLPLLLDFARQGLISRSKAISLFTDGPAKAFSLDAGIIKKGAPADIVVIDPDHKWTFAKESVRSLSLNSPFLDRNMQGIAHTVVVGGKLVVQDGSLVTADSPTGGDGHKLMEAAA